MHKEEEVELIKVGGQQLLKTALAGADGGETPSASQQVQGRNTELQRLLQDEQLAKERQMEVRTYMLCLTVAAFCCGASACLLYSHKPVAYLRFA